MVRFLEANGYDVKYISGVDTERRAADLVGALKPKAFFSVGHDEYWSAGQRASVEAARNAGVNLAFFSGNEMYWKTRFESSLDGSPTHAVSHARRLQGHARRRRSSIRRPASRRAPGATRASGPPVADGGRPENSLTGQIWTVNSGTSAISVPASMAKLRFWKNTRVENLTTGVATLARRHARLRMGRRPGQRRASRRPDSPLGHDGQRRREDPRLRRDGRHRHRDAQPDALPPRERRARLRRRHGAVVVGSRQQSRPRRGPARSGDAAGDREPARRHGRAARRRCRSAPIRRSR